MLRRSMTEAQFFDALPEMTVSEMGRALRGMSRSRFKRVIQLMEAHERQMRAAEDERSGWHRGIE